MRNEVQRNPALKAGVLRAPESPEVVAESAARSVATWSVGAESVVGSPSPLDSLEGPCRDQFPCLRAFRSATVLSVQDGGPEKGLQFRNPHHLSSGSS